MKKKQTVWKYNGIKSLLKSSLVHFNQIKHMNLYNLQELSPKHASYLVVHVQNTSKHMIIMIRVSVFL
jgi:hypothetical protein